MALSKKPLMTLLPLLLSRSYLIKFPQTSQTVPASGDLSGIQTHKLILCLSNVNHNTIKGGQKKRKIN